MKISNLITIGIAGMMGSGKSTALNFFNKKRIPNYDLDIEAKKLLKKNTNCYKEIIKNFGDKILNKNKSINKKKLRALVFNNNSHRNILNSIVHPELLKKILLICKKQNNKGAKIVVFEGALISKKSKIGSFLDYIIYIESEKNLLIKRISKRDGIPEKEIKKLLLMQKNIEKNQKKADFIIKNNTNKKDFVNQLNLTLDKLVY